MRKHGRMSLAARDVERGETVIKRDGLAEPEHQFGGARGEATAPGNL